MSNINKLLLARGVPIPYLKVKGFPKNFQTITSERVKGKVVNVTASKMREQAQTFVKTPYQDAPYILGISSVPNDKDAMSLAVSIFRNALKKEKPGQKSLFLNAASKHWTQPTEAGFVVVHNIFFNANFERHTNVRDIIVKYANVPVIVVIGGTTAIEYFDKRIHHPLTACIHYSMSLEI